MEIRLCYWQRLQEGETGVFSSKGWRAGNGRLDMPGDSGLTPEEEAIYQWQLWLPDFGVEGQERLKRSSVLVSRCGGVGSLVAYELAAAGIGRLILAHAGEVKPSDLNHRMILIFGFSVM